MKPSETKDESMQRADTYSPLRCSSPASSEAQPDHCCREVGQRKSAARGLPIPSQLHIDWFGGAAGDAGAVGASWKRHAVVESLMVWSTGSAILSSIMLSQTSSAHVHANAIICALRCVL